MRCRLRCASLVLFLLPSCGKRKKEREISVIFLLFCEFEKTLVMSSRVSTDMQEKVCAAIDQKVNITPRVLRYHVQITFWLIGLCFYVSSPQSCYYERIILDEQHKPMERLARKRIFFSISHRDFGSLIDGKRDFYSLCLQKKRTYKQRVSESIQEFKELLFFKHNISVS